MIAITDQHTIDKYKRLVSEMISSDDYHSEFRSEWILQRGWRIVLTEDCNHFAPGEIKSVVSALQNEAYSECVAVVTEDLAPFPQCFRLVVTTDDFRAFNAECGLFRFTLTDEKRSWAICCNELYNLFASEKTLVEAMLGSSIEKANKKFIRFAERLALGDPNYPILKMAHRYAGL